MTLDPSKLLVMSENAILKNIHKQPDPSEENESVKDTLSLSMGVIKAETAKEKLLKAR